ncbi:MAG: hypothetical protein AUH95_05240 [Nitrospirae bacterium 13_2_20CM_2_63_8]|nr:MAG: hypothetical protein AUH95_05240 [Nitrospirae bacterium 13_2_20CM_2_63_8]
MEVLVMAHETILLHGHIVDSLLLPKVLDLVLQYGGSFELAHIRIGKTREEPSDARIIVHAESPERLAQIIAAVQAHGAAIEKEADCQWQEAPADGVFPDDFYVTTHLPTEVRGRGPGDPAGAAGATRRVWVYGRPDLLRAAPRSPHRRYRAPYAGVTKK